VAPKSQIAWAAASFEGETANKRHSPSVCPAAFYPHTFAIYGSNATYFLLFAIIIVGPIISYYSNIEPGRPRTVASECESRGVCVRGLASVVGVLCRRTILRIAIDLRMPWSVQIAGAASTSKIESERWSESVSVLHGDSIRLAGNNRAYLIQGNDWAHLDLRGKTLRFTADVSRVPCSCNAALYFVSMGSKRHNAQYCDINTDPPCVEIDVFEGNRATIQTTIHTQAGEVADGACNQWGCTVNWGNYPRTASGVKTPTVFGSRAAEGVDTNMPFDVLASVSESGDLTVELVQGPRQIQFFNSSSASNPAAVRCDPYPTPGWDAERCVGQNGDSRGVPPAATEASASAWAQGMTMVVSLWGNDGLADWLDHECPSSMRRPVRDAHVSFSSLSISPTPSPPPSPPPAPPPPVPPPPVSPAPSPPPPPGSPPVSPSPLMPSPSSPPPLPPYPSTPPPPTAVASLTNGAVSVNDGMAGAIAMGGVVVGAYMAFTCIRRRPATTLREQQQRRSSSTGDDELEVVSSQSEREPIKKGKTSRKYAKMMDQNL
jgi:hypothetical protein